MPPSSGQNIKLHGRKGLAEKERRNQGCEEAKGDWMATERDKTHYEVWDIIYSEEWSILKFLSLFWH